MSLLLVCCIIAFKLYLSPLQLEYIIRNNKMAQELENMSLIPAYMAQCKTQWTYSIYLRETFWDCLVLMVRIYICRAARRRAVSYFNSDPNLSSTTSLQLWRSQRGGTGGGYTSVTLMTFKTTTHLQQQVAKADIRLKSRLG